MGVVIVTVYVVIVVVVGGWGIQLVISGSIYRSIHPFIYPPIIDQSTIYPPIHRSIHIFHPPIHRSINSFFILSPIGWPSVDPFIHTPVYLPIHSLIHPWLIDSFIYPPIHWEIYLFIYSSTDWSIHSSNHLSIDWSIH